MSQPDFPFRIEFPPELPISARAEEIAAAIGRHPAIVLAGETGSGKTTQIPKMCLLAGRGLAGRIACTQPRRVAALSVSRRVAEEMGVTWGREVGCKVRFSDRTTPATRIKFLTDGMLLAEAQGDLLLREYDTIIIDEAHERSLNIDFLLGHLRRILPRRPDLRVIVTSATIDTAAVSAAFGGAPVITVEGRTYPVEVVYAPLDSFGRDADPAATDAAEKAEALHYIDGAVEAVGRILREDETGDILVFLPSERDVREVRDLLEGRARGCELVPLFGRLGAAEQQRVFAPTQRRKIVVATNIAETSLTIPGIRYVVDTGLARVSRYSPQARTRRLPIEEISRASADQRRGRCGRVGAGVCVRLYSEENYNARPRHAQPEMQRANLADVILRLKAFEFGDVDEFPFPSPPQPKAVQAGRALLQELGAIAEPSYAPRSGASEGRPTEPLTAIGRELARMPVDPTVGRMILQARQEKALREVLVIAAALSIQDPRDRPLDRAAEADAAHRRFVHPDSDFLGLLNIWTVYHDEVEGMSQSGLRRFCREHFLSYVRMREWRDIHGQLLEVMKESRDSRMTSVFDGLADPDPARIGFGTPAYRAIHRSILSGLLSNIATWDRAAGGYKATHDRKVALFPGSALFRRPAPRRRPGAPPAPGGEGGRGQPPAWIMAAEIVETARVYARNCARLDPAWTLDLAAHLVKVSHSEPFWDPEGGRVLVKRRTRLHGLEIDIRSVGYGRVNPAAATEIFIREALVNETEDAPWEFLVHNRELCEKIVSALTRARRGGAFNLDETLYRFYARGLTPEVTGPEGISSVAELTRLVRDRRETQPRFLFAEESDLHDPADIAVDAAAFPEQLPLDNRVLSLRYRYRPGQEDDGVTLEVGLEEAKALTPERLDWAVPGHLAEVVEHYLRALPKELRRAFSPLGVRARELADVLADRHHRKGGGETLVEALAAELRERHKLGITAAVWADKPPPEHLRVRVRVRDAAGGELAAGRDLGEVERTVASRRDEAAARSAREDSGAWAEARRQWERPPQAVWTFGDIPGEVPVEDRAGLRISAHPGLRAESAGVALRLFSSAPEAEEATRAGLTELLRLGLRYELGWLERDLKDLRAVGALAVPVAPIDALRQDARHGLERWLCDPDRLADALRGRRAAGGILAGSSFAAALERAKQDVRGLVPRYTDLVREILALRHPLLVHPRPYAGLERDVAALVGADFLRVTPYARLGRLPCYLKAMKLRADRWRTNPAKDAERSRVLAPYATAVAAGQGGPGFRWLVEEFRVSLFAQELGTAESVSAVKLDQILAGADYIPISDKSSLTIPRPAGAVAVPHQSPEKRLPPVKSLRGLDKLFPC